MQKLQLNLDMPAAYAQWGYWPASRMTPNTSGVSRGCIESQSNHFGPARLFRWLRRHAMSFERAGLSEPRIPMALTTRPPKCG